MAQTSTDKPFSVTLGEDGEPCAECGSPLAHDQRYCLNCGLRRGEARLPFLDILRDEYDGERVRETVMEFGPGGPPRAVGPLVAAASIGLVVVILALGVLIGVLGGGGHSTVAAAPPQVVVAGGGGSSNASSTQFTGDWPSGKDGYTVDIQELPKASTQPDAVAQAKSAVQAKGAANVGALDADQYSGLTAGNYIVYSGVYDTQKQAQAALAGLKKNFPQAKVIHVTAGGGSGVSSTGGNPNALSGTVKSATVDKTQLNQLHSLSGQAYEQQSRKLPDQTKLPGTPPPVDNVAPGGGSGGGAVIK